MVAMAEAALRGRIRFWHPWHMEPTPECERIGRRIDWERAPNGDREWAHALARFTHMLDFAAAAQITGRREFVDAFDRHLRSYMQARSPERAFWTNALDSSLRVMNLLRSLGLLETTDLLPERSRERTVTAIRTEAGFLADVLGTNVANWEFFIATALLSAAECLRDEMDAADWSSRATARLSEITSCEIFRDGTFSEESPMYQGEVVLCVYDGLAIFAARGAESPPFLRDAAQRLLSSLEQLADPEGNVLPIGDSDRYPVAYLRTFADAVDDLAGRPRSRVPCPPDGVSTFHYRDSGWSGVRWQLADGTRAQLVLDASGKPPRRRRFHSHSDDLQVLLHTSHGPLLTDPGRFTYAPWHVGSLPVIGKVPFHPRGRMAWLHNALFPRLRAFNERNWRWHFQSSAAHTTISAGGRNHPGYDRPDDDGRVFISMVPELEGRSFMLGATAICDPDEPGSFTHRRLIRGELPGRIVVVDEVVAPTSDNWCATFRFGDAVEVKKTGPLALEATLRDTNWRFSWDVSEHATLTVDRDWTSPLYNVKVPAFVATLWITRAGRFRLVTQLLCSED